MLLSGGRQIEAALERHGGSVPAAADDLGIPKTTLYDKL
ncbi:MAG: hypothetical protein K2Y05_07160 [Hyphomicrobiaceae bacterium]|nr:hypothetical protein [Hyphomicrobiaceae bacterium]